MRPEHQGALSCRATPTTPWCATASSRAAVAFLQKPFTPGALAKKVRQVLGGEVG
ncbi:MAG: hypothetical protein V9E87_07745 [Gemmatimonadales bacterium]